MKSYRIEEIRNCMNNNGLLFPLDVLLVGGTGTGKSTTLNALFGTTVANVGKGVDPETQTISSHKLNDFFRLHDSAGLGDGKAADRDHANNISVELRKVCGNNGKFYRYIDLVLVVLDGSSRDLGTAFRLLESIVIKTIESKRIIVVINQADLAMKGHNWDSQTNLPNKILIEHLEEQSLSVQRRIKESTGLVIKKPIYFSAQFGFNIESLIDHIIEHIPSSRRGI